MIFAGLAFVILKRKPKLRKKLRLKTKVIVFNSIHQTVNTASLPILHGAFKSIQSAIMLGSSFVMMITPLCVATAIFIYPAVAFKFLKGKEALMKKNRYIRNSHGNALAGLSFEWLGFLFVVHLRRFFYIFLLVFMSWYPGPQIVIITITSVVVMISIVEFRPYSAREQNV